MAKWTFTLFRMVSLPVPGKAFATTTMPLRGNKQVFGSAKLRMTVAMLCWIDRGIPA